MLACLCRKKEKKEIQSYEHLLTECALLQGSNLQTTIVGLVTNLIGVTLPGYAIPLTAAGMGQAYTISLNTSNSPEPALPANLVSSLVYKTPTQIWGTAAKLFVADNMENLATHFSDVNQGQIGDCWMMAAIAALAAYGNVGATSLIQQCFTSVSPAGSNNPTSVTLSLYRQNDANFGRSGGAAVVQTIDTKIPVYSNNVPAFVKSDSPGEYWPCMMEKAVAAALKLVARGVTSTGYPALSGGFTPVGMSMFTPGCPVYYNIDGARPTASQLFTAWSACMQKGVTVCAGWLRDPNGGNAPSGEPYGYLGLVAGHAYTVFSIVNAGGYQLALLRNPWGQGSCTYGQKSNAGEWTGPWSDCSPQWAANPTVKAACGFTQARSDGLFWMSFTDIATYLIAYQIFIPDRADLRAKDLRPSPFVASAPAPSSGCPNGLPVVASGQQCGAGKGCCPGNECCSQYGWCSGPNPGAASAPWCGSGCQSSYGKCGVCKNVVVTIQTAAWAAECGWSIPGTTLSATPGSMSDNQTYTKTCCVAPGQYVFKATDSYGDGWNSTSFAIAVNGVQVVPPTTFTAGSSFDKAFTV